MNVTTVFFFVAGFEEGWMATYIVRINVRKPEEKRDWSRIKINTL